MAPWAGRTRHGRFEFDGRPYQLEVNAGAHSIHGTVREQAWAIEDFGPAHVRLRWAFGPKWPFAGWAEEVIEDHHASGWVELSLHTTDEAMPAVGCWHPAGDPQLATGGPGALWVRPGATGAPA